MQNIETHPLPPFLPAGGKILMLGSFPPPRNKWSMDFYYPNLQNDMWRIFGLVFFGDREYFLSETDATGKKKIFCKSALEDFLKQKGIGLSDTAVTVNRLKGNASDKFLEVVEKRDIGSLLDAMPLCSSIVTTGDKATSVLQEFTSAPLPAIGNYSEFNYRGRVVRHYRMPSTSRAYPLPLDKKAAFYGEMFRETGIL